MSKMPACASAVSLFLWLWSPIGELAAQNQPKKPAPAKAPATNAPAAKGAQPPARIVVPPDASYLSIKSVEPDGTVKIAPFPPAPFQPSVLPKKLTATGSYIGVTSSTGTPPTDLGAQWLLRVTVRAIDNEGNATLQIAKNAAGKIRANDAIYLFPPSEITPQQLQALPEFAVINNWETMPINSPLETVRLAQSVLRMRSMKWDMESFAESKAAGKPPRLPPAALIGPDGKPWHSWRVMALPALSIFDLGLYFSYKWDEPWDGPNNRKLLSQMPKIYADPALGENKEFYTNYVAITGKGMAFPAQGTKYSGKGEDEPEDMCKGGTLLSDVKKTGTPMIGYVGFDRKIPWMKPEDVEVTDNLPRLGEKGSFGVLPWMSPGGTAAPFVVGNEGVLLISQKIDPALLRAFLTVNAANPDVSKIPSVSIAAIELRNIAKATQSVLYFVQVEGKLHVRLVKVVPN